jgi:anaphase-promoting complex subunit 6
MDGWMRKEWEFIQALEYHAQTPEDAEFIQALYTVRLKKVQHHAPLVHSLHVLRDQFGLADDPDAAFGLADWLYSNYRFVDCFRVTSRSVCPSSPSF